MEKVLFIHHERCAREKKPAEGGRQTYLSYRKTAAPPKPPPSPRPWPGPWAGTCTCQSPGAPYLNRMVARETKKMSTNPKVTGGFHHMFLMKTHSAPPPVLTYGNVHGAFFPPPAYWDYRQKLKLDCLGFFCTC